MFAESHNNFVFDSSAQKTFMDLYTDNSKTKAFRPSSFKEAVKPLQQLRYEGFGSPVSYTCALRACALYACALRV